MKDFFSVCAVSVWKQSFLNGNVKYTLLFVVCLTKKMFVTKAIIVLKIT